MSMSYRLTGFALLALIALTACGRSVSGPPAAAGCTSKKGGGAATPAQQASVKLNAIKRLADEMAKEPDGPEARGALEDFRNTPIDLDKNPQEADEIREVYRQRIQAKYKGMVASEIQAEMGPLLAAKKGK